MSKKKFKDLRICNNYAHPCVLANKCESCRNRLVVRGQVDGRNVLTVVGCRTKHDINALHKEKEKCFVCISEGSIKCSDC